MRLQEFRAEHEEGNILLPHFPNRFEPPNLSDLQDAEEKLRTTLIIINLGILVFAGGAGYFLAGRTLRPIEQMIQEQSRFISDASHELKTPLTAIKAEMEVMLRDKDLTLKGAKTSAASNLEEVNNLVLLSNSLLELSTYQQTNGDFIREPVSLSEVLVESYKKVASLAKHKHITITNTVKDAIILGDKQQLIELFVIFLDNAIKYSPKNSTITISSAKTDHSVKVSIADEGMGIEEKDIPYIFDRFFRVDESRSKTQVAGYGLGLSIAKKIIEEHKGSVIVKSSVGKPARNATQRVAGGGTTFTVQLPLKS
jgi:signal transduction histidine kinase